MGAGLRTISCWVTLTFSINSMLSERQQSECVRLQLPFSPMTSSRDIFLPVACMAAVDWRVWYSGQVCWLTCVGALQVHQRATLPGERGGVAGDVPMRGSGSWRSTRTRTRLGSMGGEREGCACACVMGCAVAIATRDSDVTRQERLPLNNVDGKQDQEIFSR